MMDGNNRNYPLFVFISLGLLLSFKLAFACTDTERNSLMKFKQSLGDESGLLSSWGGNNTQLDCCKWWGVKCSNKTKHVIGLDLHRDPSSLDDGRTLRGDQASDLSSWLIGLKQLRHLDLSYNNFTGSQIGQLIGSFHGLRYLNLSCSGFGGILPGQLGNLTRLQTLDLSQNYGLITDNLAWLSQLRRLRKLDLSSINLNATNWFQVIFNSLTYLQELRLRYCQLASATPPYSSINSSSSASNSLSILDLSYNRLNSSSTYYWLFNITSNNLVSIDLSYNDLEGPIPEAFGETFTSLEYINICHNQLSSLPKSFQNLNNLRSLILWGNSLNAPFAELLHKLSNGTENSLEVIELSHNQFYGPLTAITRFSSLRRLYLAFNRFNGSLLNNLVFPPRLEVLHMSSNQLIGNLHRVSQQPSLIELHLDKNRLTGKIPESIGQFSSLKFLYLSSNLLQGIVTEAHFSRLFNLKGLGLSFNSIKLDIRPGWTPPFQLEVVDLANCSLGPHFPQWLETQKNMNMLDISYNAILDIIPNWFWDSFHKLTSMDLHQNMFLGSVSSLCGSNNNKKLSFLDLSDNIFTGDLPDCWMNMKQLQVLNLANNNFSGRIPESLGFLGGLRTLHLSHNSFVGEFPPSIRNCTGLRVVDVGGNRLSGNIPSWIGTDLTSLFILSLRLNNFTGNIPWNVCHLSQVQVLDLSGNNVGGRIPQCFNNFTSLVKKDKSYGTGAFSYWGYRRVDKMWVQWKKLKLEYRETLGLLKIIDLSNNKLVGQIPEEIAYLKGLISLNLSVNHLTGNILSNIDRMEMLESLDLSRNQLSGEIPISLAHLNYLALLDLSYNNLSGRIPSGTQLQSFHSSSYIGNSGLCGFPLGKCPEEDRHDTLENEEDGEFISKEFYTGVVLGFIVGLWGVVVVLFKDSWRIAYFRLIHKLIQCAWDWLYVTSVMHWLTFKRWLRYLLLFI